MLAPPCIRNALLIPETNNMTRQVSATVYMCNGKLNVCDVLHKNT